ncbi:hypothetical protein ACLOJK_011739 [Asimina triloba]
MVHSAYDCIELLKNPPAKISAVASYGSDLLVGCSDGSLRIYTPRSQQSPPSDSHLAGIQRDAYVLEKTVTGFSKKPLISMTVSRSRDILLSLSETVAAHRLPNIEAIAVVPKAKGANLYAWDDRRGFLCFGRQKRVGIFRYEERERASDNVGGAVKSILKAIISLLGVLQFRYSRAFLKFGKGTSQQNLNEILENITILLDSIFPIFFTNFPNCCDIDEVKIDQGSYRANDNLPDAACEGDLIMRLSVVAFSRLMTISKSSVSVLGRLCPEASLGDSLVKVMRIGALGRGANSSGSNPRGSRAIRSLSSETFKDQRPGHIRINELMLKARVKRSFEYGMTKTLNGWVSVAGKKNTKIVSDLPDSVGEWKTKFFFTQIKSSGEVNSTMGSPYGVKGEATEEEEIRKTEEAQLKMAMTLSCEATLQAGINVGPVRFSDLRSRGRECSRHKTRIVVRSSQGTYVHSSRTKPILGFHYSVELEASLEAVEPSMEVTHSEAISFEGFEAGLTRTKDVPGRGSLVQSPKRMAQAHGRELVKARAEAAKPMSVGQSAREEGSSLFLEGGFGSYLVCLE